MRAILSSNLAFSNTVILCHHMKPATAVFWENNGTDRLKNVTKRLGRSAATAARLERFQAGGHFWTEEKWEAP
jgi:hypothetical protein